MRPQRGVDAMWCHPVNVTLPLSTTGCAVRPGQVRFQPCDRNPPSPRHSSPPSTRKKKKSVQLAKKFFFEIRAHSRPARLPRPNHRSSRRPHTSCSTRDTFDADKRVRKAASVCARRRARPVPTRESYPHPTTTSPPGVTGLAKAPTTGSSPGRPRRALEELGRIVRGAVRNHLVTFLHQLPIPLCPAWFCSAWVVIKREPEKSVAKVRVEFRMAR